MKKISITLILLGACFLSLLNAQTIVSAAKSPPENMLNPGYTKTPPNRVSPGIYGTDKREKAREAILPQLKAVFSSHREDQEVLLTVDAGWRNDSLSIEYKYYKGKNLLTLNENLLVEKIYFTVKPEEMDLLETVEDEFQFLYLRNENKRLNVHQQVSRPAEGVNEYSWRSSFGFPVRPENLPMIIELLKDLRTKSPRE